jgi:hypothetical protein
MADRMDRLRGCNALSSNEKDALDPLLIYHYIGIVNVDRECPQAVVLDRGSRTTLLYCAVMAMTDHAWHTLAGSSGEVNVPYAAFYAQVCLFYGKGFGHSVSSSFN